MEENSYALLNLVTEGARSLAIPRRRWEYKENRY
jgi:hypothetical protein